jgi:hypothetical protein
VLGTRLKLVKGHAGSAALRLAMERGEIDGFCGVALDSMRTAAMKDPAMLADAEQASLSIDPMGAAAIEGFIDEVYRTTPAVAARAARLLGRGPQ